jgi:hypothetical protein
VWGKVYFAGIRTPTCICLPEPPLFRAPSARAPSPPLFVRPPHVHNGMRRKSASLSPPRVGGGAGLVSGARAPSLVVAVVGPSGTRATTVCGLGCSVCCAALCALLVCSVFCAWICVLP